MRTGTSRRPSGAATGSAGKGHRRAGRQILPGEAVLPAGGIKHSVEEATKGEARYMSETGNHSLEQKVLQCFHCGNKTLMNNVGEYTWRSKRPEYLNFYFFYKYTMFACPVCYKVTLLQKYSDELMERECANGEYEQYSEDEILYPVNSFDSDAMPQTIKEAFEAALKTRMIDNSVCLMALRRTLELILIDKGATKWGLAQKIEEIAEKGILPQALKEASAFTKMLGNAAAHGITSGVTVSDVNTMTEFVEYIIEYLYILPNKIEQYKNKG
jgi:hypothetical protein